MTISVGSRSPGRAGARADRDSAAEAIAELYTNERHSLLRMAALMTQDRTAAEDIVHDAFAGLRRRWDALDDPARAPAYLRVSVVNLARTFHRRRHLAWRQIRAWSGDTTDAADAPLLLGEEHRAVAEAVNRLPRRQQQVIALRYWAEMTDTEIAESLGVSPGTVRATASRALSTLLREMENR